MKELGFTLNKFGEGLRLKESISKNTDTLSECFNLIPDDQGLIPNPTISQDITAVVADHPFPQIFFGFEHWLCCTRNKIYFIQADWSLTEIVDITGNEGGTWHLADFFDYAILTNGVVNVYADQVSKTFKVRPADGDIPVLGTVTNFKGQIIGTPKSDWHDANDNHLMWGGIGSASFLIDSSNTRGYRPMPWFGEVYKVMELGDVVGVYGSTGIAYFKFAGVSPGMVKVHKFGIASREAVGGNEDSHLLIDTAGNLRVIDKDLSITDPYYKEFFSTMLGKEIVVTYDDLEDRFYITDGVRSFVRTMQGVGEISIAPTGLGIQAGVLRGIYTNLNNSKGQITTSILDFGRRGKKTIDTIALGTDTPDNIEVAVSFKNTYQGSFVDTDWIPINAEGAVIIPISGVEFKIKVRCDDYVNFNLDYITVRVKFDDKRFIRGAHVNKITA